MTKQECAVIQAYTGVCMLQGDDLEIYYSYIHHLLGRPVFTHEIPVLSDEIKHASERDFKAICNDAVDMRDVLSGMAGYLSKEIDSLEEMDKSLDEVLEDILEAM